MQDRGTETHLHILQTTQHSSSPSALGNQRGRGSGKEKEGAGSAILPNYSLGRQSLGARGENRLPGSGNKDKTADF